jgi:hypothetical protein
MPLASPMLASALPTLSLQKSSQVLASQVFASPLLPSALLAGETLHVTLQGSLPATSGPLLSGEMFTTPPFVLARALLALQAHTAPPRRRCSYRCAT